MLSTRTLSQTTDGLSVRVFSGFGFFLRGGRRPARAMGVAAASSLAAVAGIVACGAQAIGAPTVTYRTVVGTGQAAPGLPSLSIGAPFDPRFGPGGTLWFYGNLAGTGVTFANDGTIWREVPGSFSLIARETQQSPASPTEQITGIPTAAVSANEGRVFFAGSFGPLPTPTSPTTRLAVFGQNAALSLVELAREEPTAPRVHAALRVSDAGDAIWTEGGLIRSSVRGVIADATTTVPGAGSPGLPAGSTFRRFAVPTLAGDGTIAFSAWASNLAPTSTWANGIWSDRAGALELISLVGQQVPGRPVGETFRELSVTPALNDDVVVAFWARAQSSVIAPPNDTGIFVSSASNGFVAFAGQSVPGLAGVTYASFSRDVPIDNTGRAAFAATLAGAGVTATNNAALFIVENDGTVRLLARENDAAPGATGDVRFGSFGTVRLAGPFTNADPIAIFSATLRGSGVQQSNARALYAATNVGTLIPIIRTGQRITISGLDVRTVRAFNFDHDEAGLRQIDDSTGAVTLALSVWFTDNSRVVLTARIGCPADFNDNGQVDFFDYLDFVQAFADEDPRADINGNGTIDFFDYLDFVEAFDSGC
jgi:hypothetical protein